MVDNANHVFLMDLGKGGRGGMTITIILLSVYDSVIMQYSLVTTMCTASRYIKNCESAKATPIINGTVYTMNNVMYA